MKKIITLLMLITVATTFAQDPTKLKEGQIDQTNLLHKDTVNEEKIGALNSKKGFGVGDGNLQGDGFSFLPGYTGGKPVVGSFFGLTSIFGNHGSVTGNSAVYFTIADSDRGWVYNVNSAGTINNVASIDGLGRATFAPATLDTHLATLGQVKGTRPYKVYTALLNQTGTNAPVATVLENTLGGTVVWSRNASGVYYGTLSGAFINNKTFVNCSGRYIGFTPIYRLDDNRVGLSTSVTGSTYVDNVLENNSVEIRVYN